MKQFKGVVFDLNGTLLWDTRLHNQAWDSFLHRYHLVLSDGEKNRIIHGRNNELILPDLFGIDLPAAEIARYITEKEGIYRDLLIRSGLGYAPGAVDFIHFLKAKGIFIALATASGYENVNFYIQRLGLAELVPEHLIIFNDGRFKSKPDPDIFTAAIQQLGLAPAEVVIFEDSFAGIEAARRAGAGMIIIVNSNGEDYGAYSHPAITDFGQVNRDLF